MSNICPKCGLPKELCVCATIAKEGQKVVIRSEKRAFGKINTLIEGINDPSIKLEDLTKKLKSKLACGGTLKKGIIELQGNHKNKVKLILVDLGFAPETIELR